MFHPVGHPLERGWVGRVDGERVLQLAAQTLQSFFTGGGTAREHAEYPLSDVVLLAPVLHPPSVRLFDDQSSFAFANPAAVAGPGAVVVGPASPRLTVLPRLAAVIGAEGAIGGFTVLAEWRAPGVAPPKDRDFALGLGPVVVTPEEPGARDARDAFPEFDWVAAIESAAARTVLYPGDIVAGPASDPLEDLGTGAAVVDRGRRDRRPRATGRRLSMELVLDWDGTVTEVDTLHAAIDEFGDVDVFRAMESEIGRRLTLQEVIAVEMETITAPLEDVVSFLVETVPLRPGFAEIVERHDPLVVSMGFHELIAPLLERDEVEVRRRREPARPEARRLARPLQATSDLHCLRRAVQALRRRGARRLRLRRRRLLRPLRRAGGAQGLRPRRPRDVPRRERRGVRAVRRLLRRRERARRRRRRAADAQPRPEDVARLPFGRPRDLTPQRLDGRARDLVDRLLDRGERRVRPRRGVDAVEAHDGELAGHVEAA